MATNIGVDVGLSLLASAVMIVDPEDTGEPIVNDTDSEDFLREVFEDDDGPTDDDLASISPEDEAIDDDLDEDDFEDG